jgi:Effector protein
MPDTATDFDGIIIRTKNSDSKAFAGLVKAALAKLNSKPVGKALLDGIVAMAAKKKFGYTVCIMPKESVKKSFGPLIRWRNYQKGSVTKSASDSAASNPDEGTVSSIKWDPIHTKTPDGARPPFIGLAHELVHAYHNLKGDSTLIADDRFDGSEAATKNDEMRVVGLRGFEKEPISENRIRHEHGVAYRSSYDGKCSADEGSPDTARLDEPVGIG